MANQNLNINITEQFLRIHEMIQLIVVYSTFERIASNLQLHSVLLLAILVIQIVKHITY